ncbi:MAG TPA: NAD-dependent epimerase/dehydratase family protein [Chlorobiota bacterium]|nr:NAD-dependent epimerase/dehydratase family protein [Chlorobiota bacterium]
MKVLVTGATGFVGSHVVDILLERGYDVSYVARATSNHRWLDGKPVQRVDGSLFDMASLRTAVESVDYVIHVAGLTAAKNEEEFLRGNRDATRNLLDAIRSYNPSLRRYTHISTLAVCGPAESEDKPTQPDSPLRPITAYGRTKKLAEDEVRSVMGELSATIVRPPAVYGPRDSALLTYFQAVNRGIAPMIGFDEKKVSLVHVRDLARGIVDATFAESANGKTYFVSSDEFYTWPAVTKVTASVLGKSFVLPVRIPHFAVLGIAGIVGGIGKLIGKPPVLDYEKGIDISRKYWICSNDAARRDFDYRQEIDIEHGVRETIAWYKAAGWL